MEEQVRQLREVWLERAASFLLDYMALQGLPGVVVRVSCGWPSRGGLAARVAVVGQCFPPTMCKDGIPQIFVSPRIDDSLQVLGTLLHELVHAVVGCQFGHRKEFSQAARRVGLAGPPTATTVGAYPTASAGTVSREVWFLSAWHSKILPECRWL